MLQEHAQEQVDLLRLCHQLRDCVLTTGRHAGYAASYLKQQQKQIADSPYPKLKPLVLAACKGTLDRLSKMPGWKRQSARKK